jgi:hypothetical protein
MMTVYIVRGDVVTARTSAPAKGSPGEVVVGSAEEIAASAMSLGADGCGVERAASAIRRKQGWL